MSKTYIHGFSSNEQSRLTLMQTILNAHQLSCMDLDGVQTVLDVGCGLGQMTRALARRLGSAGRVLGIEHSGAQLEEARRQAAAAGESSLVEFRQGNAEKLPLKDSERGAFDLAHARFLLEHVTEPQTVVREMASAVRPGGKLFILDDDHELLRWWPACPHMERAWSVYWQSYRSLGHDPLVGRRLPQLLVESGIQPMRISTLFYGAIHGQELFEPVVENIVGVIASAADVLHSENLLSHAQWQDAQAEFQQWQKIPFATIWYSLPYVEGIRH